MNFSEKRYSKFYPFILMLALLLNYQFFYFFPLPEIIFRYNSDENSIILAMLSLITFAVMLILRHTDIVPKFWQEYTLIFNMDYLFLFLFSIIKYNQSIISVFSASYFFIILLLTYPLIYVFIHQGTINNVLNVLLVVTVFTMILLAIQSNVYENYKIIFLKGYFYKRDLTRLRDGHLRMSITTFGPLISVYSGYLAIISKSLKRKLLYWLITGFGIYCAIAVSRTRMLIMLIISCIAVMYIENSKQKKRMLQLLVLGIIIIIVIAQTSVVQNFFKTFTKGSALESNTTIRIEAAEYYIKKIIVRPLTGLGFINSAGDTELFSELRGPKENFYCDDVGFIGTASQFGIMGIVFQSALAFHFFSIIQKLKHRSNDERVIILMYGLLTYYIVSFISLSTFDRVRIPVLVLIISIFEYELYKWKQNN